MSARRVRTLPESRSFPLLSVFVLAFALTGAASATEITQRLRWAPTDVTIDAVGAEALVRMPGLVTAGGDGIDALPMQLQTYFVPTGFEIDEVRVERRNEVRIASGVELREDVRPVLRAPSDRNDDPGAVRFPSEAIDATSAHHPASSGVALAAGELGDYRLQEVALFPVRQERASGDLWLAQSLDVTVVLRSAPARADELTRNRLNPAAEQAFYEVVRALVANPSDVPAPARAAGGGGLAGGFAPRGIPSVDGSAVDMVIVTPSSLEASFLPLADWKTKKGVPTVVRTTEWIDANYPQGFDQPERIRLFLRDAYRDWGTYLLLLGGDLEQVPPRFAWNTFFFGGTDIPTDQYYSCLDGDWNLDGDQYYGEGWTPAAAGDSVDFYPDIFVARAPVETPAEVTNFVTKSLTYDKSPPANYVEDICYLGEVLFPREWEYGDPPESITRDGKDNCEDFDLIAPPGWTRTKRYQSDDDLDRTIALGELSGQHHFMTIVGHGDAFKFSVGNSMNPLIYVADTDTLTNGDHLMFVNATACNPNQFDLECQGESLMNNPLGGAIGVMGPTREDFPVPAADFHEHMLINIFDHGLTRFAVFNQAHRVPFASLSGSDLTSYRWTMQTRQMFGDPELRLWTEEPQALTVVHPASVTHGTGSFTVTVTDSGAAPVANALVCVSDGNGTYERVTTDAAGQAVVSLTSEGPGPVDVVVTAREFRPSETTLNLTASAGAELAVTGVTTTDDGTSGSVGNGDGVVDPGETIALGLTATNAGGAQADSVTVTASVEAGSSATFDLLWSGAADPAKVFIGPNGTNPGAIPFTLDFAAPSVAYIGTPNVTFSPDSTSAGDEGIYLWQDREGWHVRWSSGADTVTVAGTITTDGRVRHVHSGELEAGVDSMTLAATEDTLSFSGSTAQTDLVDEVNFALADDTMLSIVSGNALLGDIAAAASGNGAITYSVADSARDGQIAAIDVTLTSAALDTWTTEVPVVFVAPEVEAYVWAVDDGGGAPVSGNGNGIIEVGETVRLTPTLLNRGSGAAEAVNGLATAATGITFVDDADAYGSLESGAQSMGTDGYVFTVDDGSGTTIDLTLTDSLGRNWVKSIEFVAPALPESLDFESDPNDITLLWNPVADADLAGYNVYRSTTPGSGHSRINFELLRTGSRYVDAGLTFGTTQYYYVTAVDSSGNESAQSDEIAAWTTQPQVAGFPKSANSNIFSSMAIADADSNGTSELYVGSQDFRMYAFDFDGGEVSGFPVNTNAQVWSTPAFADLDGNGDLEVLFGSLDSRLYVVNEDGSPHIGSNTWILDVQGSGQTMRGAPLVADVDFDWDLEIFVATDNGTVYGFNHDGTPIAGADSVGLLITVPASGNGFNPLIWGPLACADWDDDGIREIAFGCWNDSLYVMEPDGTMQAGFPKAGGDRFRNGPVFADVDNDGSLDLFAANSDGMVYAYKNDGSEFLPGSGGVFFAKPGDARCVPAPCQLDADPELEIVITSGDGGIYAVNHDGTGLTNGSGLLAMADPSDGFVTSAIVVDVDGDSDFEIFAGHRNGRFYGYHHDGSTVVGLPIKTNESIFSTAAAGDIDSDGDVDIAFASYDETVNVLDFSGASTPDAYEWATFGGNNWRSSVYREVSPHSTSAGGGIGLAPLTFSLAQNAPNPFSRGTSIRFSLPEDAPVTLQVFNIAGRRVRTLIDARTAAGAHDVRWDGRDDQGQRVSSGIYFYRLAAPQREITRKAVRLQ